MYDIAILEWLQSHKIPNSISVLQFISSTTTMISISIALTILIISILKRSKIFLRHFFVLAIVLILVLVVSQGLKASIFRNRTFVDHPHIEKLSDAGSSSFPSGHTMEAFAVAAALTMLFPRRKIFIPIYLWAVLVAYSRMALGVHYPSDIAGGIVIGTFLGLIVPSLFRRFARRSTS